MHLERTQVVSTCSHFQQLDSLRRQRDHLRDELNVVMETRNKKQHLSSLEATMHGLQNKIRYAKRDKEVQVSKCLDVSVPICACMLHTVVLVWTHKARQERH